VQTITLTLTLTLPTGGRSLQWPLAIASRYHSFSGYGYVLQGKTYFMDARYYIFCCFRVLYDKGVGATLSEGFLVSSCK